MTVETQDVLIGSQFISTISQLVKAHGIHLESGSDFHAWQKALKEQPERNVLAPKFDPEINDLSESTAFWITGRDRRGEIVHTQAARLIDLGGSNLASHLQTHFTEFVPAGHEIDKQRSLYRGAPGSRRIAGTVCYHGELWLKGGPGGFRGAGMTAVLARLAMAMCLMKWSPDYVFGFMFPLAACKGLAAREGYMHVEPAALYWSLQGQADLIEEWSVWMAREDIQHILCIPPTALFDQLEGNRVRGRGEKAA